MGRRDWAAALPLRRLLKVESVNMDGRGRLISSEALTFGKMTRNSTFMGRNSAL